MGKYNFSSKDNHYKTPPILYEKALQHFGIKKFSLDTCCTDENIPADSYYKNDYHNGLIELWTDYSWCNPPFNKADKWVKKAFKENSRGVRIAMLIPVRTETAYWHNCILHNPKVTIEWLRKGYKFLDKDNNEMGVFKNALALVYFE